MKKNFIVVLVIFISSISIAFKTFAHHHIEKDYSKMSVSQIQADSNMQQEMAQHQQMEAVDAFPNYHPLIVHFPIVLLLLAAVFQLLSFFFYKKAFSFVTFILLALGVISAWLASNTFHAETGKLIGKAKEIFMEHEQMATYTWWISFTALVIKIPSHFFFKQKWWIESVVAVLLIASAVTVSIAGDRGAMLVYMQGIGPQGKYLDSYSFPDKKADTNQNELKAGQPEEDHHVGEIGKGPHDGTVEEADPFHMEIVPDGNSLVFYLLDGDAKPLDMAGVTGKVNLQYNNKKAKTIELMLMDEKLMAMDAINGQPFTAVATLKKNDKSYSASFDSNKDLPAKK